jgi:uncharacterized membrane protein
MDVQAVSDRSPEPSRARLGWPYRLVLWSSVIIAIASWRYLIPGAPGGAPPIRDNAFAQIGVVTFHAAAASVALLVGPFQFLSGLRSRRPDLHRWMGRTYVLACLFGGVSGAVLAAGARTGLVSTLGFGLLAVAWLATTWRAYDAARQGRIAEHRRWMIRSFALTFAAVTLRLYVPLAIMSPWGYDTAYRVISFACWIPNMIFAEALLARRRT